MTTPDAQVITGTDAGRDARIAPLDAPLSPDAACASETATATLERLPVDIIWVVDNSTSMRPAIEEVQAGLDDFAALIAARDLDYRVILLSLRDDRDVPADRYPICIPRPLAGDDRCGDGPAFFHVDLDVRSTQPLEQILGTLGQTEGYRENDGIGSAPWADLLREGATRTIVVVTDDNARMVVRRSGNFVAPRRGQMGDPVATADFFETFGGGRNPFNSSGGNDRSLPEGLLDARWEGLFDGYIFSAIYGWGDENDPEVRCRYPGVPASRQPPSSGPTYTELVERTGGVRAKICDGPAAWGPFFDSVATAVERGSRIDCAVDIPPAPEGTFFERDRINVFVDLGEGDRRLGKVASESACDARGGWYYDDEEQPTSVNLCPATCEAVQEQASGDETRRVEVQFGCQTIPI